MWQMLKVGFDYSRVALIVAYGISIQSAIATFIWDANAVYNVMMISGIIYLITIGLIGLAEVKEKRDRSDAMLPLSIRKIAIGRMLLLILFQLAMFSMWLIVWIFQHEGSVIWSMLTTNAVILSIVAILTIYHDLGFFGTNKYYWTMQGTLAALYLAAGLLLYLKGWRAGFEFLHQLYVSPAGASLSNLLALGLLVLSVNIYIRRKSFLA